MESRQEDHRTTVGAAEGLVIDRGERFDSPRRRRPSAWSLWEANRLWEDRPEGDKDPVEIDHPQGAIGRDEDTARHDRSSCNGKSSKGLRSRCWSKSQKVLE